MVTIGDRIKQKRKELGLTQAELGQKLNVTDRAVSKWEQNEGNPDMSLIAPLANVLGVTLDYLITGKQEETISLDDMDEEKRALYFIKNDDVDNFKKYGYLKEHIIFKENEYNSIYRKEEKILDAIYNSESVKIFTECLNTYFQKLRIDKSIPEYSKVSSDLDCWWVSPG